jgi:hypothetical protein
MGCLKPPLLAKPAKGYSWVCITCSLQRRKDVEEQKFYHQPAVAKTVKPKVKDKAIVDTQRPDVTFKGWSWRYFGCVSRGRANADCIHAQKTH